MRMFHRVLLVASLLLTATGPATADDRPLARIAFGSCAKQDKPQSIWDAVVGMQPQLFVFLGDNIYADTQDMDVLRAKYALLAKQPGYQKLLQTCHLIEIFFTWVGHHKM